MFDRNRDGIKNLQRKGSCRNSANAQRKKRVAHLVDVFQFVNDLVHHGVGSLHFDFWVRTLSLDPAAHHTQGVAADKRQTACSNIQFSPG